MRNNFQYCARCLSGATSKCLSEPGLKSAKLTSRIYVQYHRKVAVIKSMT